MFTLIDGEPVSLGIAYGYCFQPEVLAKGQMISYSPAVRDKFELHPYFDTTEEAIKWLKDRGLRGQVQRYAHHEPESERGENYSPWVTSGVTGSVDGKPLEEVNEYFKAACDWADTQKVHNGN